MSSAVQDELDKIKNSKVNIRKAIIRKHVDQPENPLKSYPDGIDKIDEDVENTLWNGMDNYGAFIRFGTDTEYNAYGGPITIRMNSQDQLDKWTQAANPTSLFFDRFAASPEQPKLNALTTAAQSNGTFNGNTRLEEIYYPENITEVGNYFLYNCTKNGTWDFRNLRKVGNYFAANCNIVPDHWAIASRRNDNYSIFPLFNSLEEVGDYFMQGVSCETKLDLTSIKKAGNYFLYNNKISGLLILPDDCDFTGTTYPLRGFQYACTIWVPENWKLPINNYTLSAQSSSSPAYSLGIKLVGPGAESLAAALPNRTGSPYRKLIVEKLVPEYSVAEEGELIHNFDMDGKWFPYRCVYHQSWSKHFLAEFVYTGSFLGNNGLIAWGTDVSPLTDGTCFLNTSHNNGDYTSPTVVSQMWEDFTPSRKFLTHWGLEGKDTGCYTNWMPFQDLKVGDMRTVECSSGTNYYGSCPTSLSINALGPRTTNTPNVSQMYNNYQEFVSNFTVYAHCSKSVSDPEVVYPDNTWLDYDHYYSAYKTGIAASGSNGSNTFRIGRDRLGKAREYWLNDSASTSTKYYVTTSGSISSKSMTSTSYWRPHYVS